MPKYEARNLWTATDTDMNALKTARQPRCHRAARSANATKLVIDKVEAQLDLTHAIRHQAGVNPRAFG
ncbi:hypothetical protein MesoLj131c_66130 (plasmid) [Mesorhizobium sp. 131-3-5]|nr:hypothetical protein MesoLj131c_66130 [Mesorhizobium sp. 131-3-5]